MFELKYVLCQIVVNFTKGSVKNYCNNIILMIITYYPISKNIHNLKDMEFYILFNFKILLSHANGV
jgi:hypothetical protein